MKKLCLCYLTGILLSLLFSAEAGAQPSSSEAGAQSEIYSYGINHRIDSAKVVAVRARMDSIRSTRPVVALVLSGGGAKGVAHIGAIRRIEELGIPVDMVLGTSMGGLIGGMYSLGYGPDDMEKLVSEADWSYLITDKQPRKYISLNEMTYKGQHQICIPFYYEKDYYRQRQEYAYQFSSPSRKHLSIGAEDEKSLIKDNFMASLPESYVPGQNVMNLINSITVGYSDEMDFLDLPTPLFCTSSDMVSLQAKRWYSGELPLALRSTMSIPILYSPVRTEGMVLVDGGMRDNYPVALARELGADIVIGVELSNAKKEYSDVNNLADILSQGVDMLGADSFIANENAADVKIKPYLPEYGMLSFDDASIEVILERGYEAAVKADSALIAVRDLLGRREVAERQSRKAVNIAEHSVRINEIEIVGLTDKESRWLLDHVGLIPGGLVNKEKMDHIVGKIVSYQSFDSVTYSLSGESEPYKLVLHCVKGPVHQIGLGARFDTEEIFVGNLNLGLNARKMQGSRFNLNAKVSANPSLSLLYSYDSPKSPTINAEFKAAFSDIGRMNLGTSTDGINPERSTTSIWKVAADVYVSNIKWKRVGLRGGLRNEFFSLGNITDSLDRRGIARYDISSRNSDFFTIYLDASDQTYDRYYYPTRGYFVGLYYGWTFAGFGKGLDFNNFHTLAMNGRFIVPCGDFFTFIPSYNFRWLLSPEAFRRRKEENPAPTVPYPFMNMMGGSLFGRYMDQQVPFIGLNYATQLDNIMMMVRTDFQFRIGKNHYVTGMLNYARDCHRFATFGQGRDYIGGGVEYAYNSIVGPLSVNLHWSNLTRLPGIYISMGYIF